MNSLTTFKRINNLSNVQLAEKLDVTPRTIATMLNRPLKTIEELAIETLAVNAVKENTIELDVTEWHDKTYGNTYFSAWVKFRNEYHFLKMQYGYGSHCETVAIEALAKKGLIPNNTCQRDLRDVYNIRLEVIDCRETLKRHMYDGSERPTND